MWEKFSNSCWERRIRFRLFDYILDNCYIYSLGIILYEMLTDRVPFEGDTPLTVGVKQKTETPKDPKDFNKRIPDDLNGLILKCLEKEREKRYQSAGEVRAELERLEQGLPTTDRVVAKRKTLTSKEITVQFSLKKIFIPAFAVIALAVIGLILWSPWAEQESAPIPTSSDKPSIADPGLSEVEDAKIRLAGLK